MSINNGPPGIGQNCNNKETQTEKDTNSVQTRQVGRRDNTDHPIIIDYCVPKLAYDLN